MRSDYTADGERLLLRDLSTLDGTPRSILATLRGLDNKVLREISFDGSQVAWKKDYVYRDGALLASVGAEEGIRHYHLDHLGTPRLVTNRCGERNRQLTYWPFGEEIVAGVQDGTERLRCTSHERDLGLTNNTADDLDYMHARSYAPILARFLSVDPGRDTNPKAPQSWNLFAYTRNNPLHSFDPTGLKTFKILYGTSSDAKTAKAYEKAASNEVSRIKGSKDFNRKTDKILYPKRVASAGEVQVELSTKHKSGPVVASIIAHANSAVVALDTQVSSNGHVQVNPDNPQSLLLAKHFAGIDTGILDTAIPLRLIGCQTAAPGQNGEASLAETVSNMLGIPVTGATGQILFPNLGPTGNCDREWITVGEED